MASCCICKHVVAHTFCIFIRSFSSRLAFIVQPQMRLLISFCKIRKNHRNKLFEEICFLFCQLGPWLARKRFWSPDDGLLVDILVGSSGSYAGQLRRYSVGVTNCFCRFVRNTLFSIPTCRRGSKRTFRCRRNARKSTKKRATRCQAACVALCRVSRRN